MAVIETYEGNIYPRVMMGTAGSAGDLTYLSTGSALTLKSNADAGTDNTSAFLGVLIDHTVAGSYGAMMVEGVVQLQKILTANKIEAGDVIYANGAASNNLVGTVAGGTSIGVCVRQSPSTSAYVSVLLQNESKAGAGGFHA